MVSGIHFSYEILFHCVYLYIMMHSKSTYIITRYMYFLQASNLICHAVLNIIYIKENILKYKFLIRIFEYIYIYMVQNTYVIIIPRIGYEIITLITYTNYMQYFIFAI